jgi:hypothetical protein
MPIRLHWHDADHTILIIHADSAWSWDDFNALLPEMVEKVASSPQRVDLIKSAASGVSMPRGPSGPHFQRVMKRLPSNFGMMVIATTNPFTRAAATVFLSVYDQYRGKVRFAASVVEALQLIEDQRGTQISG